MTRVLYRITATPNHRKGDSSPAIIVFVLLLAVAGGLIGYLIPLGTKDSDRPATQATASSDPRQTMQLAAIHRMELSAADVTETAEAPSLAIDDEGHIYLAFASQVDDSTCELILTESRDGGATFSEPRIVLSTGIHTTVSESNGRRIERRTRMLPHIAAWQGRLFLSWVSAGESREEVVMRFAESIDDGASWSDPINVHRNRDARPTFTAMGVGDDGTVVCSWLDNRNGVQQPFAAVRYAGEAEFALEQMVYAGPGGAGICPCCPTNAFVLGDDVLVAFRGNEAGIRDMWVSRLEPAASAFGAPECVVEPTWEFSGCPHDGPSMAHTSSGLHVAWMDAHTGVEQVYLTTMPSGHPDAESRAGVTAFPAEHTASQGHPQIAADDTRLHLVWDQSLSGSEASHSAEQSSVNSTHQHGMESSGAGRAIYYAFSDDSGRTFSVPTAIAIQPEAFQTRPQLAIAPDGSVFVAWMELSESGKVVVVARLPNRDSVERQLAAESSPQ